MKCEDLQLNLPLYADGRLLEEDSLAIRDHLEICPICRQKNADVREIRSHLMSIKRPEMPEALRYQVRFSVQRELSTRRDRKIPLSSDVRDLLTMRVMPVVVGVFSSLLIGTTFLALMFSGLVRNSPVMVAAHEPGPRVLLSRNSNPFPGDASTFISPTDFAHSRTAFSSESPSINPQGGLVALTESLLRGELKDEEVVVVADVFGNGLARISEVVESPRNSMAVLNLEEALQSDPSFAAFVPAVLENRPENMRIVLKFRSVNVSTGLRASRRRS